MRRPLLILRTVGILGAIWLISQAVSAFGECWSFGREHPGLAHESDLILRTMLFNYVIPLATIAILLLLPYRRSPKERFWLPRAPDRRQYLDAADPVRPPHAAISSIFLGAGCPADSLLPHRLPHPSFPGFSMDRASSPTTNRSPGYRK